MNVSNWNGKTYENQFTQYGMNQGLKLFQHEGEEAIIKELQQMHDLEVVEGMEPSSVTPEMRKKALSYLMFLKRKNQERLRDGGVQMDGNIDNI